MRVVTRADWDGLVCAAFLKLVEDVDSIRFIEPGEFQSGALTITSQDILANIPYRKGCGLWFDHHLSNKIDDHFEGAWWVAPSAARVIYEHYNSEKFSEFGDLLAITDRIDSAKLTIDDIKTPAGYILVSMTVEGKRLGDEDYWLRLIELIGMNDLDNLMKDQMVREKCALYQDVNEEFRRALLAYSNLEGKVLITDFRNQWHGEPGNRFLAYTLFPDCNIWIKASDHPNDTKLSHISVGHSVFDRSSKVIVGDLMAKYGGGGHKGAGSCRPLKEDADKALEEIIAASQE